MTKILPWQSEFLTEPGKKSGGTFAPTPAEAHDQPQTLSECILNLPNMGA